MWVTKNRAQQGDVFGMQDKFEGLGIFFDTYKNNRPGTVFPYVMAMLGDGQTVYDKGNDGKANELAGCSVCDGILLIFSHLLTTISQARGVRNANFPTKARVTYFAEKSLKVELMYKKEDEWSDCFEVKDIKLPSVTYLGFSGETGELSDNHDVIKVETKNLYTPSGKTTNSSPSKDQSRTKYNKSKKNKSNQKSGGWGWFFLKFILFGLSLVGAYVGFTLFRQRRRERF